MSIAEPTPRRELIVRREPQPALRTFRSRETLAADGKVRPLGAPGAVVRVADLLP